MTSAHYSILFLIGFIFFCLRNPRVKSTDKSLRTVSHCDNGVLLVNTCICNPGWAGKNCQTKLSTKKCSLKPLSDACMDTKLYGRFRTSSRERYKMAQGCEEKFWSKTAVPLRNKQQAELFNNFEALPVDLGSVLEIGCGPYTKLRLILETAEPVRMVQSVWLNDPLIKRYLETAAQTSYNGEQMCPRDWEFFDFKFWATECFPVRLDPYGAEKPFPEKQFDTIIMMNVIEHVFDSIEVLNNMYNALKPGGTLIFYEEVFENPEQHVDKCHPIKVRKHFYDKFLENFIPELQKYVPHKSKKGRAEIAFIGTKPFGTKPFR